MALSPLAQRLYDKTKSDLREHRSALEQWHFSRVNEYNLYEGSLVDIFWDKQRIHLEQKIAEYFEWIERESQSISPASMRYQSIEQSVGAVISYSSQVQSMAIKLNSRWQKLVEPIDRGQWDEVDQSAIAKRGARLVQALGLGPDASWTAKFNNLGKDHPWFFQMLSVAAFILALAAFIRPWLEGAP